MDYEDQLNRAMDQTPDIEGSSDRFDVPEPEVRQEGNKTVYENFQSTTKRLDREDDHVMKSLQSELGTSGHIDESGRLRLTGEFDQQRVQAALDDYVEQFVICPECGLPDTKFEQEKGALMLRCEACGALSPTSG